MFELPSIQFTETSSDDSCGVFKKVGEPDIVNIKKVSPAIKAKLARKLFQPLPADQPRIRKSAILKFFGDNMVSSTPTIKSTPENDFSEFISPITSNGCESSINAVSKSKSKKATLKNVVKTFNQEVNRILKEKGNQNNASVQVNESLDKSQIRERLKIDDTTTKILQNKIFSTRQTQTSDSLNTNRKLSENNSIQSEFRSDPLKALEPNSIISISDISVSEISKSQNFINSIKANITEKNVANEAEKINEEAFSVSPKIDVTVSNESIASSSTEVLSHLNLETQLKESDRLERKGKKTVSETTPSTVHITPLRERLRSRAPNANLGKEKTTTNKRKGQASIFKKAKKRSPEIPPATSKMLSEELSAQKMEYSKPPDEDEVPVPRRSKRNNKFTQKVTQTRNNSKRLDTCAEVPSKESLHSQLTESSKLQLSQLKEFSPCVTVESMQESEPRNAMAHKIDLYQYVVHRKSGFYQLPAEPITAATAGGRPQRTRRPPKQFIQAAYIPDLPPVRRTTKFKPRKTEIKDAIRNKKRTELPLPLSYSPPEPSESKKKSSTIKKTSRTKKPVLLEEVKEKSLPKRRAAKRLEYENGLKNNDGPVLLEEANNVQIFFDKSQVCISDNTISGVQSLSVHENNEEEVKEEDTYLPCLIDNKSTNVKCFSTMPLFETNNGNAIETVHSMVNQTQNGELRLGHMKILPHKKLLVEVNKHLCVSYVVIRGSGVAKIGSKEFAIKQGSIIYIPLGVSYLIHNNTSLPLILQYTINSKL